MILLDEFLKEYASTFENKLKSKLKNNKIPSRRGSGAYPKIASGDLYDSIQKFYKPASSNGYPTVEVSLKSPTWKYVEYGRKPRYKYVIDEKTGKRKRVADFSKYKTKGSPSFIQAIKNWLSVKGLNYNPYAVRYNIQLKGIEPTYFYTRTAQEMDKYLSSGKANSLYTKTIDKWISDNLGL